MSKELFNDALRYINEHFREKVSEAEEDYALEVVDKYRCPIDDHITDVVGELMGDFTSYNDIEDEDWWREFAESEEAIYWMLYDVSDDEDDGYLAEREKVINDSHCYTISTAFQRAMKYVEENNPSLYKELIHIECQEAFG